MKSQTSLCSSCCWVICLIFIYSKGRVGFPLVSSCTLFVCRWMCTSVHTAHHLHVQVSIWAILGRTKAPHAHLAQRPTHDPLCFVRWLSLWAVNAEPRCTLFTLGNVGFSGFEKGGFSETTQKALRWLWPYLILSGFSFCHLHFLLFIINYSIISCII